MPGALRWVNQRDAPTCEVPEGSWGSSLTHTRRHNGLFSGFEFGFWTEAFWPFRSALPHQLCKDSTFLFWACELSVRRKGPEPPHAEAGRGQVTENSGRFWLKCLVAQLCLILCDLMDCSLPGSSAHGILQARILEWVVISFSRGSFQPKDQTRISYIAGRFFTIWATNLIWKIALKDLILYFYIHFIFNSTL